MKVDVKGLVGFHLGGGEEVLSTVIPSLINQGFRLFQVFLHTPMRFLPPQEDRFSFLKDAPPDVRLVVHGPYVVSLVADSSYSLWKATLAHTVLSVEVCSRLGIPLYVTHIGGHSVTQTPQQALSNLTLFCEQFLRRTEGCQTILCLENGPGSKSGRKMGSVPMLYKVVQEFKHPRLRLCYDTEHAYADGTFVCEDPKLEKLFRCVSLVHLNAIPSYVVEGGHLDRHSFTLLTESKEGTVESLMNVAKRSLRSQVPMVLERRSFDVLLKDYETLVGMWEVEEEVNVGGS